MRARRARAIGGVVGPAAFVAAWAALGTGREGYSPVHDAISRLAAVGADTRPAMTAGFVTFGVGVPLYATALREALPGPAWLAAAACGVATTGVALLPLDGPYGDGPHAAAAGAAYASLALTPLLASSSLAGGRRAASVAVGLACGATLLASVLSPSARGALQRAGLTLGDVWLVASAVAVARGWRAPTRP